MTDPSLSGLRVLLVEDDRDLAASVCTGLKEEGCTVNSCFDGGSGLHQAERHAYDILLMDVMLPVMDGFEVTKRLRLQGLHVPIILLTGLDASQDVIRGLNMGADDYLTKPFDFDVLVARLQARTRRAPHATRNVLRFADLAMDIDAREVTRAGNKLDLTRTEFAILEYLMRSAGRVAPRDRMIDSIWPDKDITANNLDTFIRFLRQKIDSPELPRLIHTTRGVGYCLRESLH